MWSELANSVAGIVTASVTGDWGLLASSIVQTVGNSLDILSTIDWSFLGLGSAADPSVATTVVDSSVAETTADVASTVAAA